MSSLASVGKWPVGASNTHRLRLLGTDFPKAELRQCMALKPKAARKHNGAIYKYNFLRQGNC
jgi:hypothetical protein